MSAPSRIGNNYLAINQGEHTAWRPATFYQLLHNYMPSSHMNHALRVLDANINRAAEGLRTLEDYARLVAEDEVAAGWMKSLRHQLAMLTGEFDRSQRLATRAVENDAGTDLTTTSEIRRRKLHDIVPAAAERVTQALRNLEEFSKLLSATKSSKFKEIRYTAYDLLAQTELRLLRGQFNPSFQLYVLVDCRKPVDEFAKYLVSLAHAGVDLFQLRDKSADGNQLLRYARAAVHTLGATETKLMINDRVDIALASGAVGVHLGQEDMPLADARKLAGERLWIGISTHNTEQVIAAERCGADYIGCGPTFPSSTKQFSQFAGTNFLHEAIGRTRLPIFAIGGIDFHNIKAVMEAGSHRVAVSGVIHNAPNPILAVNQLKLALSEPNAK